MPEYIGKLLAVFAAGQPSSEDTVVRQPARPLIEPLSKRELEVLRLITQGLSNHEIGERLFLALDTVKGHKSEDLWQTPGPAAHRSCRARPRAGSGVETTPRTTLSCLRGNTIAGPCSSLEIGQTG